MTTPGKISSGARSIAAVKRLRSLLKERRDVYLVGGALRDVALGTVPADIDMVCGNARVTAAEVAEKLGSRSFRLGKDASVVYRIPLKAGSIDFSALSAGSIKRDLKKRDFTVNAIGMRLDTLEVLDPLGGIADAENGILRMCGESSFEDDPLRILKGYRMRACFPSLAWEQSTRDTAARLAPGIRRVAAERVQMELVRMLIEDRPSTAVAEMAEDGVLFEVFPPLAGLKGLHQPPPHRSDALQHTLDMMALLDDNLAASADMSVRNHSKLDFLKLRLAMLFHDSGKAERRSEDEKGIHFYGHDKASARIAREALSSLRFSNSIISEVCRLVELHMRPLLLFQESGVSTAAKRRLIRDADMDLPLLLLHAFIDFSSMERRRRDVERFFDFTQELFALFEKEGEKIIAPPKLIDGISAMQVLGIPKPGPELGRALIALRTAQSEGEVRTPKQAEAFLKRYRKQQLGT